MTGPLTRISVCRYLEGIIRSLGYRPKGAGKGGKKLNAEKKREFRQRYITEGLSEDDVIALENVMRAERIDPQVRFFRDIPSKDAFSDIPSTWNQARLRCRRTYRCQSRVTKRSYPYLHARCGRHQEHDRCTEVFAQDPEPICHTSSSCELNERRTEASLLTYLAEENRRRNQCR